MEQCLLCLETRKESDDYIQVNSEKWNQQEIKYLIEKHLWPMVSKKEIKLIANKNNLFSFMIILGYHNSHILDVFGMCRRTARFS